MESKFKYTNERNVQIVIALLKAHGIHRVIASPGTTNMTFVVSIENDPWFQIWSSVDERSAAYLACGMAAETGEPVAISCTGATASRNYMPGLTEAYYRKLPVLAITSTRGSVRTPLAPFCRVYRLRHLSCLLVSTFVQNAVHCFRLWHLPKPGCNDQLVSALF